MNGTVHYIYINKMFVVKVFSSTLGRVLSMVGSS